MDSPKIGFLSSALVVVSAIFLVQMESVGNWVVFYSLLAVFICCWSMGVHSLAQFVAVGITLMRYAWPTSNLSYVEILQEFGVIILLHFGSTQRMITDFLNTWKTLVFDWIILLLIIPLAGISDLFWSTSLFFPGMWYFIGNIYGLFCVKLSEQLWTSPRANEDFEFSNMLRISRNQWKVLNLNMLELCLAVWTVLLFSPYHTHSIWTREIASFSVGALSTIMVYFAPVSQGAKAALTPAELIRFRDSNN